MISPSFSLTATERVLPRMALDFTTASLDNRVTFTRSGNTATVVNSSGVVAPINADLPRFDYNPTTLICNGLLIEEARTNLLLNSLLDGTSLATQLVTTTAVAHTLSFYGTGQIVLTGTSSATVIGTGAYPSRKTLTFTPTAGVLTLTVTGTVQYAQLEVGAFVTSFIPTAATTITRNADVATMTGTNFSDWFNASQGAFYGEAVVSRQVSTAGTGVYVASNAVTNSMSMFYRGSGATGAQVVDGGVTQADLSPTGVLTANQVFKSVLAYKVNDFAASGNAGTVVTDAAGTVPTLDRLLIGLNVNYLNGHVRKISYYPQRLINAEVQAFSK
jgi:hypothetical protein